MTRTEYIGRLKEVASLACTLRSELEELERDVCIEWASAEMDSMDDTLWRESIHDLEDLSADANALEEALDKLIENTEEE